MSSQDQIWSVLWPVSWRPTTVKWRQFSQSSRHSTIGTRQTQYHEALPSSVNVQSHLTSSFAYDGNASWYSVCRVPMVKWRLGCENCRYLTVVCLHDTGPCLVVSLHSMHRHGGLVVTPPPPDEGLGWRGGGGGGEGARCRTTTGGGLASSRQPENIARSSHRTQKKKKEEEKKKKKEKKKEEEKKKNKNRNKKKLAWEYNRRKAPTPVNFLTKEWTQTVEDVPFCEEKHQWANQPHTHMHTFINIHLCPGSSFASPPPSFEAGGESKKGGGGIAPVRPLSSGATSLTSEVS